MHRSIFFSFAYIDLTLLTQLPFLFRPQFRRLGYAVSALELVKLHVYFIIIVIIISDPRSGCYIVLPMFIFFFFFFFFFLFFLFFSATILSGPYLWNRYLQRLQTKCAAWPCGLVVHYCLPSNSLRYFLIFFFRQDFVRVISLEPLLAETPN